jgi:hypothetical protein
LNAIRVKAHIDSETLRLPELKPMIGMDVEIIVLEEVRSPAKSPKKKPSTKSKKLVHAKFWARLAGQKRRRL